MMYNSCSQQLCDLVVDLKKKQLEHLIEILPKYNYKKHAT